MELTLDIGSGTGEYFEKHRGENIIGVDSDISKVRACDSKGFPVVLASGVHLPFKEKVFSRIHSYNLIEHMLPNEVVKLFLEVKRCLEPRGEFEFGTPVPSSRFWNSFSHIKPYPPKAIEGLLGGSRLEKNEELACFKIKKIKYNRLALIGIKKSYRMFLIKESEK
jgi:SAM-dependent methyltransferase